MTQTTTVLIVDMQDFFLKNLDPFVKKTLLKNQLRIIDACTEKNFPFILLEYGDKGVSRGKTNTSITSKIKNIQLLVKNNNSGFTKTTLDLILKKLHTKNIIVMGINANGCVQDTIIGALKRKYKIITSHGIIANSYKKDLNLSAQNKKWYQKNTSFFENIEDLLVEIEKITRS